MTCLRGRKGRAATEYLTLNNEAEELRVENPRSTEVVGGKDLWNARMYACMREYGMASRMSVTRPPVAGLRSSQVREAFVVELALPIELSS